MPRILLTVEEKAERNRIRCRAYAASHSKEAVERAGRWEEANPEKSQAAKRKWRRANPEKINEINKAWKAKNPEKVAVYKKTTVARNRAILDLPNNSEASKVFRVRAMLYDAKKRAKKMGIPFNIKPSDVNIPDLCPVFGTPMVYSRGSGRTDNSPSLDRVINSNGYVKGNVIVVSWLANRIKNDASPEQIRAVADFYGNKAAKPSDVNI